MTKDSTSADDATGQPAALSRSDETLGGFLKRHRISQGKDLDEAAQKTRIHASTLRAIEEDNPKALPAEVFARGFIKNYAQYLGLDPNEALTWYIEQNNGEARPTEKINVQEVLAGEVLAEGRTFPWGRIILFFIVVGSLFFAGYLVLSFLNASAPPVNHIVMKAVTPHVPVVQPPPIVAPEHTEPGSESGVDSVGTAQPNALPQQGVQTPALSAPSAGAEKVGQEDKASPAVPEKAGQGMKDQKVQENHPPGEKKADAGKPVIVPQAFKQKPGQSPEPQEAVKPGPVSAATPTLSLVKAPGMNYVLEAKFTATTWLSVQVDKEKKKSGIYQPGDHLVWQAAKKISLFVGNAGGIVLTLNGKPVPPIGKFKESARVSFPSE